MAPGIAGNALTIVATCLKLGELVKISVVCLKLAYETLNGCHFVLDWYSVVPVTSATTSVRIH
jgi:hypothetical protein